MKPSPTEELPFHRLKLGASSDTAVSAVPCFPLLAMSTMRSGVSHATCEKCWSGRRKSERSVPHGYNKVCQQEDSRSHVSQ